MGRPSSVTLAQFRVVGRPHVVVGVEADVLLREARRPGVLGIVELVEQFLRGIRGARGRKVDDGDGRSHDGLPRSVSLLVRTTG
jgi:hypothetical protein